MQKESDLYYFPFIYIIEKFIYDKRTKSRIIQQVVV